MLWDIRELQLPRRLPPGVRRRADDRRGEGDLRGTPGARPIGHDPALRREARMSAQSTKSRFERALVELQVGPKVYCRWGWQRQGHGALRLYRGVPEFKVSQVIARHSERSEESRPGQAIWVLSREILRFTAFRSE